MTEFGYLVRLDYNRQNNLTLTKLDGLGIIWSPILRRFQIWCQNLNISLGFTINGKILHNHALAKFDLQQIGWPICLQMQNSQENPNLISEFEYLLRLNCNSQNTAISMWRVNSHIWIIFRRGFIIIWTTLSFCPKII